MVPRAAVSAPLFDPGPGLPDGLVYQPELLTPHEEAALIAAIQELPFGPVVMHGVEARRRVAQFGWRYGFDARRIAPADAMPAFLQEVRDRVARVAGQPPERLAEVLVTEYPAGAGIGWHRDAPAFAEVAGVSLGSACRLRFRRGRTRAWETRELPLAPRSVYVLDGPARMEWQHSIPAVDALRYSVTFRTLRSARR